MFSQKNLNGFELLLKLLIIGTSKGQLISKCPFGHKTSSKKPTKLFLDFCPEIFCSFLGASLKLFGTSCSLMYNITYYVPRAIIRAESQK